MPPRLTFSHARGETRGRVGGPFLLPPPRAQPRHALLRLLQGRLPRRRRTAAVLPRRAAAAGAAPIARGAARGGRKRAGALGGARAAVAATAACALAPPTPLKAACNGAHLAAYRGRGGGGCRAWGRARPRGRRREDARVPDFVEDGQARSEGRNLVRELLASRRNVVRFCALGVRGWGLEAAHKHPQRKAGGKGPDAPRRRASRDVICA